MVLARNLQLKRFSDTHKTSNAEMNNKDIEQFCTLDQPTQELLQKAVQRLDLSTRAYYRTLKLARTIADLAGSENIAAEHVTEALGYREQRK